MRRQLTVVIVVMAAVAVFATGCGARLSKEQIASAGNGQLVNAGSNGSGSGSGDGTGSTGDSSIGTGDAGGTPTGPSDPGAGGATGGGSTGGGSTGGGSTGGGSTGGGSTATTAKAGGPQTANACPAGVDNGGATDVGVSGTEIKVGNVSTIGGPVPGLFKGAQLGAQAYVSYINSQGGICGRKLTLIVKDDGLDAAANKAAYSSLVGQVFAILGSFSVVSDGGYDVVAQSKIPDISYVIGPKPLSTPNIFSPAPLPTGWPTGSLNYYKKRFPDAVTKMAYFTLNADQARSAAEGQKAAALSVGYKFVYEKQLEATETGYDQYAQGMKNAGAQGIFVAGDVTTMANLARAIKNQNLTVPLASYGGNTYDPAFITLAGAAAEGAVLTQGQSLFQGEDAGAIPEIATFTKFYRAVGGKTPDLFALYSWASGMLLRQGLLASGPKATRQGLIDALSQVHAFNANGMFPDEDVAGRKGSPCYVVIDVKAGKFQRDSDSPSGYRCNDGPYFTK